MTEKTNALSRLYSPHGILQSTRDVSKVEKFDANQFYQYSQKADCALAPCSMWRGGDYMEFGSTDLNTFRNMLTAADINNLPADTEFWAFDIFGDVKGASEKTLADVAKHEGYSNYIDHFAGRGDLYEKDKATLNAHGIRVDKCHMVQGYFEETLNEDRKDEYLARGRQIGFACLDCNIAPPYRLVFEFIFDLMKPDSYIYMDEYFSGAVIQYFDQFMWHMRDRRNIEAKFMGKAGGFGALFYLYPTGDSLPPLRIG